MTQKSSTKAVPREFSPFQTFLRVMRHLPIRRRRQFWLLSILMFCSACIEMLSVASIALFASTLAAPSTVNTSKYIETIKTFWNPEAFSNPSTITLWLGVGVITLLALKSCIQGIFSYASSRYATLIEAFFGEFLLNGFAHMPYQWHLSRNTADLIYAFNNRIVLGRRFVGQFMMLLNDILIVSILLAGLFVIQPIIFTVTLIVLSSTALLIFTGLKPKLDSMASLVLKKRKSIHRRATKAVHGVKDVMLTDSAPVFVEEFRENAYPLAHYSGQHMLFSRLPMWLLELVGITMLVGAVAFMLLHTNASPATIAGNIALLAVAAWRILPAVSRVLENLTKIRNAMPDIRDEFKYIDDIAAQARPSSHAATTPLQFNNTICFDNVSFTYDGAKSQAISNISLTIRKGDIVGIIGKSGAGKSTFVDLLIGFLQPSAGRVTIDNTPITEENAQQWMPSLGYVPQTSYICDATLAQNIAFGIPKQSINEDKVMESSRQAAIDFVDDLPNGIHTQIGERGALLSGGQRQRVAIARALYNTPNLIIFDEATSALDTKSEKSIQDTMYSFKEGHTLVIIAHRLSTVEGCDYLIWMENGSIVMSGSPDKILHEYNKQL